MVTPYPLKNSVYATEPFTLTATTAREQRFNMILRCYKMC